MDLHPPHGIPARDASILWHQRAAEHDARAKAAREQRDRHLLVWAQEATQAEIARALGITAAGVSLALERARRRALDEA